MTYGLTDSDMNRLRLGFGISGDTESRRRAAAAGVAPLTTSERIRRDWGWGPDSSPESQRAFQAAEVMERGGSTFSMPAEYGGFPTGSSRRDIRMRDEWIARENVRMKLEEEERERQKFLQNQLMNDLRISSAQYESEKNIKLDQMQAKIDARVKFEEAAFTDYANQFNIDDPTAASRISEYISRRPVLANSDTAKNVFLYFQNASANSMQSQNIQTRKAIQDKVSEARSLGISDREIDSAKTLDQSGAETFDMGRIQYMIDTTKGQRLVEAEKRREPEDIRTPFQKAQDDYAIATARLGAYLDEDGLPFDEESEVYRRAKADVLEAETRIKRSERTTAAPRLAEEDEQPRYSQEQIDAAKAAAGDPQNPRSRAARRFLNSIGESY
jgi:hypothetical protein